MIRKKIDAILDKMSEAQLTRAYNLILYVYIQVSVTGSRHHSGFPFSFKDDLKALCLRTPKKNMRAAQTMKPGRKEPQKPITHNIPKKIITRPVFLFSLGSEDRPDCPKEEKSEEENEGEEE